MASNSKVVVSFDGIAKGESRNVTIQPGSDLVFNGVEFKDVKIDIVDSDVIVTNPEGARLIFPGMALLMFEDELMPRIFFDDDLIQPNVFLSKVGEIGNLSVQDYIAISSILRESMQQEAEDQEKEKKEESQAEAAAAAVMQAIQEAVALQQAAQLDTAKEDNKNNAKKSSIDEEGAFLEPRPPIVEKSSNSGISFNIDEAPENPEQKPLFEVRLLQPGKVIDAQDGIAFVRGGGGSEASVFDGSNESQFSTETLNFATSSEDLVVEADNSDLFSETRMTRVIELQPVLPVGFKPSRLLIEGFPDGFIVEGATRTGSGWELINPTLDERGNVRVNLTYPVPSDAQFTLHIKLEANFDPLAVDQDGIPIPAPLQTFMETEGDQKVLVRNVFEPQDLNFIDQEGDLVWVLANNPNSNRIFTGSGNDSITGGVASDALDGGDGNDWIFGARGDDTLVGGRGNDTLLGGLGSDLLEGGGGSDTADYSAMSVKIVADLLDVSSGAAYVTLDPDGDNFEEDRLRQVENILAGSNDDTLIGDDANNLLSGGAGSDLLVGHGGFDTLLGGAGIDTVDYTLSAKALTADLRLATDNVTIDTSNQDTVLEVEIFIATEFDDRVIGSDNADTIHGGSGDDRLSGGRGNDHLDGGAGTDDYVDFSDAVTGVTLNLGESPDQNGFTTAVMGTEVDRLKGFEHVTGSSLNDQITGSSRAETLQGAAGDDILNGAAGDDVLDGGTGADAINGNEGADLILVSVGADRIDGGAGRDTLDFTDFAQATSIVANLAGAADGAVVINGADDQLVRNLERIIATAGNDTLYGDGNDNVFEGRDGDDALAGGGGNDTLVGGAGRDSADYSRVGSGINLDLSLGVVNDDGEGGRDVILEIEDLTGSAFNDVLVGDRFNNVLTGGDGNDVLQGRAGDDTLVGGNGSDTASYSQSPITGVNIDLSATGVIDDGEGGQDTFISIENLEGSGFADLLTGDDQDNILSGLGGNDTLNGGLGRDHLRGGTGDDRMVTGLGADTFDGGEGSDWADYSSLGAGAPINVVLNASFDAVVTITGQDNDVLRGIENISATAGNDVLRGDTGQNTLQGNAGDDVLSGGSGADQLDGGAGFDQLRFDDLSGFGVVLDLANRTALYRGDSSIDSFNNFEIYLGSAQGDEILSSAVADTVDGNSGNDTFFGGAGGDEFDGNAGADTVDYSLYAGINFITVTLHDTNAVVVDVDGGDDTQIIRIENVVGSAGNDVITGGAISNVLRGYLGNDRIDGGDGDDSLFGDSGSDTFISNLGNDSIDGGSGSDTLDYTLAANSIAVDLASGEALNDGDGGTDTIVSVENIIGTGQNDNITGSAASNRLEGRAGNDVIRGGTGSDVLDGGAGTADQVRFDDLLDAGVVLDLNLSTAAYAADGSTDTLIGFELFYTTNQNDRIIGSALGDVVFGLGGTDSFIASAGNDTLDGGLGRDVIDYSALGINFITVTLNAENDAVVTVNGGDNDIIRNIEGVIGTGGNDQLTGDSADNSLVGGAGNDVIRGGRGNDILDGGAGVDQLRFDELTVLGIELNLDTGTATFGGDGSTDSFTGFEEYYASNQADTINGSASADVVFGLAGADTFNASAGLDTFDGGNGRDLIDYSNLAGVNFITLTLSGSTLATINVNGGDNALVRNIENVRGTAGNDQLTGDDENNDLYGVGGADTLTGGIGDDLLDGGQGNDFLRGGEGNDSLQGGSGSDTADYSIAAGGVTANLATALAAIDGDGGTDTLLSIENLLGSANADILNGNAAINTIDGAAGNDVIRGGAGSDVLIGGADTDQAIFDDLGGGVVLDLLTSTATSIADNSVDSLSGFESYQTSAFTDTLIGSAGMDIVSTLAGDDSLNASAGADTLDGGADVDTLDYSALAGITSIDVTLNGSINTTVTVTGGDNDTIRNIENIIGSGGDDRIQGDGNANLLEGRGGADRLVASRGVDILDGGAGIDTADFEVPSAASAISVVLADAGDTTVTVTGGDNNVLRNIENVVGTAGRDVMTGNNQANVLSGRGDNDTLNGAGGNDTLLGEAGNDLLLASLGTDVYDGGADTDTLNYSGLAGTTGISFILNGSTDATVTVAGGDNDIVRNVENIVGTGFADDMTGDVQDNFLEGLGGADRFGASGGADTLDGGAGIDTVDYSLLAGVLSVTVTLNSSTNAVVQVVGGTNDLVRNIENVTGSGGGDTLTGDGLTNVLRGESGSDVLAGRGGLDTLIGGTGVDTADYTNAGSAVTVNLEAELASVDGDGAADVLQEIENLRGSAFADTLRGGTGNNLLEGAAGNDLLVASAGADTFDGGAANDTVDYSTLTGINFIDASLNGSLDSTITVNGGTNSTVRNVENLIGSTGNDILAGDLNDNRLDGFSGDDRLRGRAGNDILDGGAGIDTADYSLALSSVVADLGTSSSVQDGDGGADTFLNIENLTGSTVADTLTGNSGANVLDGNAGDDTLHGRGGIDTLDGNAGTNTASYANAAAAIAADLALGATSNDGDGASDVLLNIQNIQGSAFNDVIYGSAGDNSLLGLAGNDVLRGRGGSDILDGGANTDTADYAQAAAAINANLLLNVATNDGDGGSDVYISIENISGSNFNDRIEGNNSGNSLFGGLGNDRLLGNGGADTLDGGANTDVADYSTAAGAVNVDLATNSAADDGSGSVDTLIDIEDLTGSNFDDQLQGNSGANRVDGGSGNDTLAGRGGNDSLVGGADEDTADYRLATAAIDVNLQTGVATNDGEGGSDVLNSIEHVLGSGFADVIRGSTSNNTLLGNAGNDTLAGNAGADVLDGGADSDTASYESAGGSVSVNLSANLASVDGDGSTDTLLNIENVRGSLNADTLIGDGGVNVLDGMGGNDELQGRGGIDTLLGNGGVDTVSYELAASGVVVDLALNQTIDDGDGASDVLGSVENATGSGQVDTLLGSAGANLLSGGQDNDTLSGRGGADTLDGGADIDTADYSGAAGAVIVDLSLSQAANDGDGSADTLLNIENIAGSDLDDVIIGNAFANLLDGGEGDDTVSGRGGADVLVGGDDIDLLDYSLAANGIVVNMATGVASNDGDGSTDSITEFENLRGSANGDQITGDALTNVLEGLGGSDTFFGSAGLDTVDGGLGNDTISFAVMAGVTGISVQLNSAVDAVIDVTGSDDTIVRNVENVIGTAGADIIRGDGLANTLDGGGGADTILGGNGSDVLIGGTGVDQLRFDDLNGAGVTLNLGTSTALFAGDGSTDSFSLFESYFLSNQADALIGSNAADTVSGMGGDDVFNASAGTDTFDGGSGSDTIDYSALGVNFVTVVLNGASDATVTVNGGDNDTIRNIENVVGSAGNDVLTGDALSNLLSGSAGNDTLDGAGGTDSLVGGAGNDLLLGSDGADTFDGSSDIDTLDYSLQAGVTSVAVTLSGSTFSSVTLSGSDNDLVANVENVIGSSGNDLLAGDNLANVLTGGAGGDTLSGHGGADTLIGGADIDTVDYSDQAGINFVVLTLNGGSNATVTVDGDANDIILEIENVVGSTGGDTLIGDSAVNIIDGDAGNDTIIGGVGIDTLIGGDGIDTLDYSLQAGITSVFVDLDGANTRTVTVVGGDNDVVRDFENVRGTAGNDTIDGDSSDNLLFGMDGDDLIRPELGNDTLDGGNGNNTLSYDDLNTPVVVDMSVLVGGYFTVTLGSSTQLATNFIHFTGSINNDRITGDNQNNLLQGDRGLDTLIGGGGADTLQGGDDSDTLTGGLGNDLLEGDAGDDLLIADAGADTFDGGAGVNDVLDYSTQAGVTSISFTLNGGSNATVTVNGDVNDVVRNVENVVGTAGADIMTGDSVDNELYGAAGNDTLDGGAGADYLDGGADSDRFLGSAGADQYEGGAGIDTLDYSTQAGINFISVVLNGSFAAAVTIDGDDADLSVNIENVVGTAGNDSVWGDSGINVINGGGGADELAGRGGNDTLDGDGGSDRVRYYEAAAGVVVNLASGTTSNDGDGGVDTLVEIENVWGSTFNDLITGDNNANSLHGWEGNDTFIGSGGADIMDGWTGVDTVDYSTQAGVTSISVTLNGSSLVTVVVTGDVNDTIAGIENVIGTSGNDVLIGDNLVNTLSGLDGDDTIVGWGANDVLDGGAGADTLSYSGSGGVVVANMSTGTTFSVLHGGTTDTAISFQHIIGGLGSDTLTGDAQDNILNGGDLNDILDGGLGNDTLIGGNHDDVLIANTGSDSFDGGSAYDYVDYRTQSGVGRVELTMNGSGGFTAGVFNGGGSLIETDTASSIEFVYGSGGNDTLVGDASGVDFYGEGGDDTFRVTTGTSTINGGAGSDTLDYSTAAGGVSVEMTTTFFGSFIVADGGGGSDLVSGTERFIGSGLADTINTNSVTSFVDAGAGDDSVVSRGNGATINGGTGADTIYIQALTNTVSGDAGNDHIIVDDGGLGNAQILDGGADNDTVNYSAVDAPSITTLSVVMAAAGDSTVTLNGSITNTIRNFENLVGSQGADTITGNAGLNILSGSTGNDTFFASGGADTIDGGADTDTLDYSALAGITSVSITLNQGASATVTVGGGTNQVITNIENISATSGADILAGDASNNTLLGLAGNDTIFGSLGNDNLQGGADVDQLRYDTLAGVGIELNIGAGSVNAPATFFDSFGGFESYVATNQADTITGSNSADTVEGADGNDSFIASAGLDTLDGGAGNDSLSYSALGGVTGINVTLNGATPVTVTVNGGQNDTIVNFESIVGSGGDDIITGDSAANRLDGSAGADTLNGGGGNDSLNGGSGNDLFLASDGNDVIDGGVNTDTADYSGSSGSAVTVILNGGTNATVTVTGGDNDTISNVENFTGTGGSDVITGDTQINVLRGLGGADILDGGSGNDTLDGGLGNDTLRGGIGIDLILGDGGADVIEGGADADTLDYSVSGLAAIQVTLNGGAVATVTVTGDSNDSVVDVENIVGTTGSDTIYGDSLVNTLNGFNGDDTLYGAGGADTLDGGSGLDTVNYTLAAGVVVVDLATGATSNDGDGSSDTLLSIENATGSGFADTLLGSSGANLLSGGGGDDLLRGRGGIDVLDGQGGFDTADYAQAAAAVTASLLAGAASSDGDGSTDAYVSIENLSGSGFADTLAGNNSANTLLGNAGNDVLTGGGGADTLDGGADIDTASYATASSGVTANLLTQITSNDGDGASDTLILIENLTGSSSGDTLTGNTGVNVLLGNGGADVLNAGTGDDTVEGGAGNDSIMASDGADTFDGGADIDTLDYTGSSTTSISVTLNGATYVTVTSSGDSNDSIRNIENVIGTGGVDTITGDSAVNIFTGGAGNDVLAGRGGSDTLDGGADADTVDYTNASAGVTASLLTQSASDDGDGASDTFISIEHLRGSAFADTLTGDTTANTLQGQAGNDVLAGRAGSDTLDGGADVDTADYTNASAGVTANLATQTASNDGDAGSDTLVSIENLTGSGSADNLTGSSGVNVINANGGADVINAGAGSDTVDGGAGNDSMVASDGADTFDGGADTDTLDYTGSSTTSISVTLNGATLATVTSTGDSNDSVRNIENIIGTGGADTLIGDSAVNVFTGGAGNDVLGGRGGNDTLDGGADTDTADFTNAAGAVTANLTSQTASNDGDGGSDVFVSIENLTGSGSADNLTGSSGVNVINANGGADVISAGTGNDTVDGGAGTDSMVASDGADTFDGGADTDTLDYTGSSTTSISVTLNTSTFATVTSTGDSNDLVRNIENVIATSGTDTLTGDSAVNVFTAGAGDDVLAGRGGSDTLDGGADSDTVDYSNAAAGVTASLLSQSASNDGDGAGDTFVSIEHLRGSAFADTLTGDTTANTLQGQAGNDVLAGRAGNDTLDGGADVDTADYTNAAAGVTANLTSQTASNDGDGGNDILVSIENLTGSGSADNLTGSSGVNVINANGGADVISAGAGNDTVDGGAGNDSMVASDGADTFDGGADTDTLDYTGSSTSSINVTLNGATLVTVISAGDSNDSIRNIENVIGTGGVDTITGDSAVNIFTGGAGNDVLGGRGGNDTLDGGADNDTADYTNAAAGVTASLLTQTASNDGDGGSDTLVSIENLRGSGSGDLLTGDAGANTLQGQGGGDVLYGRGGHDTLDGGADNDTADYTNAAAGVTANLTTQTVSNDGDGSNDTLISIENLTGSENADVLTGSSGDNVIQSIGGADVINAGAGNDTVDGGAGNDTIIALDGADSFDGGADTDTLDYTGSSATSISVTLNGATFVTVTSAGDSNDSIRNIENITATSGADTLTGDSAVNVFTGGAGNDVLAGRGGNDTLDGGADTDTADFTNAAGAVTANLTSQTASNDGDGGSDVFVSIENLTGSGSADNLTGSSGVNVINANGGADVISAGTGNDTVDGGAGNDSMVASDGADTFDGGADTDTLDYTGSSTTSISVTLNGSTLVTVTSTGDSNDSIRNIENVIGTGGVDTLTGDSLVNTLSGAAGNDVLAGRGGNDTLNGGADADTADYTNAAAGVTASVATQTASVDGDGGSDTFISIENLRGSASGDLLTGDSGSNTLQGQAGGDVLYGRGGNDTLDGGADVDTADYTNAAAGVTANLATQTVSNDGDGSNDTLVSIENLTGSENADVLTGSTGDNLIQGIGGADTISAGAGNDTVNAGAGNDTVHWGTGTDTYDGGADTDTLDYTGASAITTGSIVGTTGTITSGGEVDTVSNIENFILTANNDLLTFDTSALASLGSVDGQGGSDSIRINDLTSDLTDAGLEGSDFAAIFSDVEELDFRGTDLTGGDTFDIGNNEIGSISGGTSLTLRVDVSTIALADINPLAQGGATIVGDNTIGNVRTVDWDNGTQLVINGGP